MSNSKEAVSLKPVRENTLLNERYLIVKKIATGGMGNIYQALDLSYDRLPIAVKVLHQGFLFDDSYVARFKREVELAKEVSHPNVVKIFDLIENDHQLYFTMEYIAGYSLEERPDDYVYTEEKFARLVIEVIDGLKAIHAKKIVHRDIKPGNIMLQPDGSHKIIDFGIGRGIKSKLTKKNIRVGSIYYIAPEAWLGKKSTYLSDYYSLGCMLFELWNGELPFRSENYQDLMKEHTEAPVPEFSRKAEYWIESMIRRLMSKDPKDRFQSEDEIFNYIYTYSPASQAIQSFHGEMGAGTIRSGAAMMSVFKPLNQTAEQQKKKLENAEQERRAIVFSLRSTKTDDLESTFNKIQQKRRGKTIVLKLPRNSALVFEFALPTREFLYLGFFLATLNIFDWYLTGEGVNTFGIHAEGNHLLKSLMEKYGADNALFYAKGIALVVVLVLTVMARKSKFVKDLVGFLSVFYLLAAIIPWIYILYYQ